MFGIGYHLSAVLGGCRHCYFGDCDIDCLLSDVFGKLVGAGSIGSGHGRPGFSCDLAEWLSRVLVVFPWCSDGSFGFFDGSFGLVIVTVIFASSSRGGSAMKKSWQWSSRPIPFELGTARRLASTFSQRQH
jgi:hypothetical protein